MAVWAAVGAIVAAGIGAAIDVYGEKERKKAGKEAKDLADIQREDVLKAQKEAQKMQREQLAMSRQAMRFGQQEAKKQRQERAEERAYARSEDQYSRLESVLNKDVGLRQTLLSGIKRRVH